MPITHFGSVGNPVDGAAATNATTTITVTPPASMLAGDLVMVFMHQRGTATFSVGVTGGQTWNALTRRTTTNVAVQCFWARYNGTWGANPRFDFSAGTCTSAIMHVLRPTDTTYQWTIDQAEATTNYAAPTTPFTVTRNGVTNAQTSTVSVTGFFSADDNTWTTLSGAGWSQTGMAAQYRNVAGTDQSAAFAYRIAGSGASGNVSLNQATLGGDEGLTTIVSFYETAPTLSNAAGSAAGTSTVAALAFALAAAVGASAGTSTVAALANARASALGSSTGTSTAVANFNASVNLSGTSAGSSTSIGFLEAYAHMVAAAAGTSTAEGQVGAFLNTSGSVEGSSTAAASVQAVGSFAGLSAGSSTAAASVIGNANTAAAATGTSTAAALLSARADVAALAAGSSTAEINIGVSTTNAAGSAAGTSTAAALAKAVSNTSGSAAGTSQGEAIANAVANAAGSAAGTSQAEATLEATANTAGTSTGTSTAICTNTIPTNTSGSAAGTSTATANIEAVALDLINIELVGRISSTLNTQSSFNTALNISAPVDQSISQDSEIVSSITLSSIIS